MNRILKIKDWKKQKDESEWVRVSHLTGEINLKFMNIESAEVKGEVKKLKVKW